MDAGDASRWLTTVARQRFHALHRPLPAAGSISTPSNVSRALSPSAATRPDRPNVGGGWPLRLSASYATAPATG
jgi:hypothetical protein